MRSGPPSAACAGSAAAETLRTALDAADRLDPVERDAIYTALVAHLRSCRPDAVSPMSLGPPTDGGAR